MNDNDSARLRAGAGGARQGVDRRLAVSAARVCLRVPVIARAVGRCDRDKDPSWQGARLVLGQLCFAMEYAESLDEPTCERRGGMLLVTAQ